MEIAPCFLAPQKSSKKRTFQKVAFLTRQRRLPRPFLRTGFGSRALLTLSSRHVCRSRFLKKVTFRNRYKGLRRICRFWLNYLLAQARWSAVLAVKRVLKFGPGQSAIWANLRVFGHMSVFEAKSARICRLAWGLWKFWKATKKCLETRGNLQILGVFCGKTKNWQIRPPSCTPSQFFLKKNWQIFGTDFWQFFVSKKASQSQQISDPKKGQIFGFANYWYETQIFCGFLVFIFHSSKNSR